MHLTMFIWYQANSIRNFFQNIFVTLLFKRNSNNSECAVPITDNNYELNNSR